MVLERKDQELELQSLPTIVWRERTWREKERKKSHLSGGRKRKKGKRENKGKKLAFSLISVLAQQYNRKRGSKF